MHESEMDLLEELKGLTGYSVTYVDPETKAEREWLPIESDYLVGKKQGNGFGLDVLSEEVKRDTETLIDEAEQ
jgi:hypothetical protein